MRNRGRGAFKEMNSGVSTNRRERGNPVQDPRPWWLGVNPRIYLYCPIYHPLIVDVRGGRWHTFWEQWSINVTGIFTFPLILGPLLVVVPKSIPIILPIVISSQVFGKYRKNRAKINA